MPPPDDPLLNAFAIAVLLTSLVTWIYLAQRWWRRGTFLDYEPRRPVPWGAMGAVLAVLMVLNSVAGALSNSPVAQEPAASETPVPSPTSPPPDPKTPNAGLEILKMIMFGSLMAGAATCVIAIASRATWHDLGLPIYADEFARDVVVGVVACFAAIPAVHGVLALVEFIFPRSTHHPLVETVLREANPGILALASVSAVIVAPICEEITFRLLLQGWLEKCEHARIRRQVETKEEPVAANSDEIGSQPAEVKMPTDNDIHTPPTFLEGWLPIMASSLLFSLAHVGQGAAPIPLFLLAIVLGYTYQRTHRIVPCIVAHAVFNLLTMTVLWLSVIGGGE